MRIGILTGGGDVPGLNPAIQSITQEASRHGWEVVGFRRGWAGVLNVNPDDPESCAECFMPLDRAAVRRIDRTGGTVLHTSRVDPAHVGPRDMPGFLRSRYDTSKGTADCTGHILRVLEHLKIDALVPIGGEITLAYAARLHGEGVKVVAVPKTMDNDVYGTDYCIGFSTAVTRSVEFINALRTPSGSHERVAMVELFGRHSGETALMSGFLADADRVLIAEVPFDVERLAEKLLADRADNPSRYAMAVISEGAEMKGIGGLEGGGIGEAVGEEIKKLTGLGIVSQSLAYMMRAGRPDAMDTMVARSFGAMAVQLLDEGRHGVMVSVQDGNYTTVPGDTCIRGERRVNVDEFYDVTEYKPRLESVSGKPMFLY